MPTAFRPSGRSRRSAPRKPGLYSVAAQGRSTNPVKGGSRPQLRVVPPPNSNPVVRRLPASQALPLWLRRLVQLQRSSLIVAIVLVTLALVVYGSTVYTQQLWSKEYHNLQSMERNERQMTMTGEVLKNQLAQQAERPASGLIPRTPAGMIAVPSAPQRPATPSNASSPPVTPTPDAPLGY